MPVGKREKPRGAPGSTFTTMKEAIERESAGSTTSVRPAERPKKTYVIRTVRSKHELTLPKRLAEEAGIKVGSVVKIVIAKTGELRVQAMDLVPAKEFADLLQEGIAAARYGDLVDVASLEGASLKEKLEARSRRR